MSVGFVLLAHEHPDLVARLARALRSQGAPVVIHLDKRVARPEGWGDLEVIQTQGTEWGGIGLVRAALDGAAALLAAGPLGHVFLISGACLPIRPVAELRRFLARHPGGDFIESVPAHAGWVQGGLAEERFTLWHPWSWRRQRRLFDLNVAVQRRLGVRRRLPDGLVPHLGGQWWCLSVPTLDGILGDPALGAWLRFFGRTWIPDEGFFQTLVRRPGGGRVMGPGLTLVRFDPAGRPYTFHDDHAGLLAGADYFFARKIDPGAAGLRARFLDGAVPRGHDRFVGTVDPGPFAAARGSLGAEHRGLAMVGRAAPAGRADTPAPYAVVVGLDGPLPDPGGVARHGRLFAPGGAEFAGGGTLYDGNIPGLAAARDRAPGQFLARVIWADAHAVPPRRTAFRWAPGDTAAVARLVVGDPNARLILIGQDGGVARLAPGVRVAAAVTAIPAAALAAPDGWGHAALTAALRGDWDPPAPGGAVAPIDGQARGAA